jgi:hypothetical protein
MGSFAKLSSSAHCLAVFAGIGTKGEPRTSENSVADSGKRNPLMMRIIYSP